MLKQIRLFADPLVLKEIRIRMRARTVVIVENLYILAICGIVFLSLLFVGNFSKALGWEIGSSVFRTITYVQAILMFFVSPLVAASAVASEKEQKTYDTLCVTPVSAGRIVWAKLVAALSCFLVLIMVSLPLVCISFILGGVAPSDVVKAYAYTILSTATAGAMGLYWSTRFERSIASIPAASICAVLLIIIAPMTAKMNFAGLSMISPVVFLNALYADLEIPFLGRTCFFWIPGLVFLLLIFLYLVVASATRLKFAHERRYVLLRFIALMLFVCLIAFVAGENVKPGSTPAEARGYVSRVLWNILVILTLFSPWLGANIPVSQSENRNKLRSVLVKAPSFALILLLAAVPFLVVAIRTAGDMNMPVSTVWLVYVGSIGLSVMTWGLLSFRLSDRETTKGRFVGMAVAYVIVALIVIVPMVIWGIAKQRSEDMAPMWVQYVSLMSPLQSVAAVSDPHHTAEELQAVIKVFGAQGWAWVTMGFYSVTTILLCLSLLWRRRKGDKPTVC